jgi:hypothetical protein
MSTTTFNPTLNLYLPRVYNKITEERIIEIFGNLGIGNVSKVVFIPKPIAQYNAVHVYFDSWFKDSQAAYQFQKDVLTEGKMAKLVYDDPWYWIVEPLKTKKDMKKNSYEKEIKTIEALSALLQDNMDNLDEEDYMRIESFENDLEDGEIYEDYEKAVGNGLTKEDLDRCEEYFNKDNYDNECCEMLPK